MSRSGRHFLAIDLGAESGRAILGHLINNRLSIQEILRFPNKIVHIENHAQGGPVGHPQGVPAGHLHWDVSYLFNRIKEAIVICSELPKTELTSMAIDTWGVDFGLLDGNGNLLELPYTYRDARTQGAMEGLLQEFPRNKLYNLTGIQFLPFNTIFQLYAMRRSKSAVLESAKDLLFIPDIFNYFLTGIKGTEFTFATTSQLFNPKKMSWEKKIFSVLGLPIDIMQRIISPGSIIGAIKPSIANSCNCAALSVVAVGSHDTASAVAAVPAQGKNWAFISSGTWSCMGVESEKPIITSQALKYNFTNEGGVGGRYRFLKNIAGLWLIQQCRKEWMKAEDYSYADLMGLAKSAKPFKSLIDPDAPEFARPQCMPDAINTFCRRTGQDLLKTPNEFSRCIIESLGLKYKFVYHQLQQIYPYSIDRIHIIGGGAKNRLLCQFAANALSIPVMAGPAEATSVGNLMVQVMASGYVDSLDDIRKVVRNSFNIRTYYPQDTLAWNNAYQRFLNIINKGA